MFDIEKQVAYWRDSAVEDLQVAQDLIKRQRTRHGLFFLHLALEKLLKALVCRQTQDLAPRTHNLIRLAELAEFRRTRPRWIFWRTSMLSIWKDAIRMCWLRCLRCGDAKGYLREAEAVYRWLMSQLQGQ